MESSERHGAIHAGYELATSWLRVDYELTKTQGTLFEPKFNRLPGKEAFPRGFYRRPSLQFWSRAA